MTVRRALRKAKMTMKTCVLRDMAPDEVRRRLEAFTASYVVDWEDWLGVAESNRVSKFASILRSWNATRPLPMRRPRGEASHEPPYIEDLLDEAVPHLEVLSDLTVTGLALATPDHINALHGLWATFSKLPQKGSASCVGITKAIMLCQFAEHLYSSKQILIRPVEAGFGMSREHSWGCGWQQLSQPGVERFAQAKKPQELSDDLW
jgi:hypothetical protein